MEVLLAIALILCLISLCSVLPAIRTSIGDAWSAGFDPQLPIFVDAQADAFLQQEEEQSVVNETSGK